jgi:hypothetical protein
MATPIVLTLLAATACTGAPTPTSVNVALSCVASEETSSLPGWARAGFTPPDQPVVHVNGLRGDILGVVFGDPLHAPPIGRPWEQDPLGRQDLGRSTQDPRDT